MSTQKIATASHRGRRFLMSMFAMTLLVGSTLLGSATPASANPNLQPSVSPTVAQRDYTYAMWANCRTEGQKCTWCPRGYSCAIVDAPPIPTNLHRARVFYFYQCRVYSVQNWHDWGSFINNQTGGAQTTLYGRNMNVLARVPADSRLHFYDLEPVWYVRTC